MGQQLIQESAREVESNHGTRPASERRHSFRVHVPASASLWVRGQLVGYYTVADLSIGGCSLHDGPERSPGESVDVVLHVAHRQPLFFNARVKRTVADTVAVCFEHLAPVAEEILQDIVVETFANVRTRDSGIALVVEPRHAARHTLVRTLRELGKRAVGVSTALDAIQLLVEESQHVHTVFIEAESNALPTLEIVEYLAHNHPHIKRVLIGESSDLARHWLEETSGDVHAVIDTASDRETLHRLLRKLDRTPNEPHQA